MFMQSRNRQKCRFLQQFPERNTKRMNTPVIIKFPFQRQTADNPKAVYANINLQTDAPEEILDRSILINGDIAAAIHNLADKV